MSRFDGRPQYEDAVCICCKGKWRIRVIFPLLRRSPRTRYIAAWKLGVICGRCNSGKCGGGYDREIVPCSTGRLD